MARPLWQVSLIKKSFPTPRIAKLTLLPWIGKLVQYFLFRDDEIVYLPINESISGDDQIALPSDVVRHFVTTAKQRWVMNECRGCGRCVTICPEEAIKIEIPDIEGLNKKLIEKISSLVDI